MILVMGSFRESIQDLRRNVEIVSRKQVAFDEIKIALRTSSELAGENVVKDGGVEVGAMLGEELEFGARAEHSLTIFSLKNFRKEFANIEEDMDVGSTACA